MGFSDFLGALGNQLADQFSLGENTNHSLDTMIDGKEVRYGALGEFANKFDHSAERKYLEEGYLREDPYSTVSKQLEVMIQEPDSTILIKKRMFSSIAENFRPDFMDADEKLYFKAIKILFQNKCRQIATLEKLSKIQKVTSIVGQIDNYFIPIMITLMDELESTGFSEGTGLEGNSAIRISDKLKRIYGYNIASPHTSWITDSLNLIKSQYAEGTGVIEITNFSNLATTTGVDMEGNSSFTIHDPYGAMLIKQHDIERAISDASNVFYTSKTFQAGKENITVLINDLQNRLNSYRENRGASPISFRINPDTLLGHRVVAIMDRLGKTIKFDYSPIAALAIGLAGSGVEVAPEYLKGGAEVGDEGLDTSKVTSINEVIRSLPDSELNIFERLIKAIFNRLMLIANANSSLQTANKKTNYARRKLTFNFLGKLIIQPMDVVHIYISSKTKYDSAILGGLSNTFNGLGFLQTGAKSITDLTNAVNAVFNPGKDPIFQIEKAAFVGKDFPNKMWLALRSQFVDEKSGVHVFGGLIDKASDNWSEGKFTVNVSCKDNTAYFEMGKINFKPGVDVFNGAIFDPLTPFKSNFDTISSNTKMESPELLEENKYLLSDANSSALAKHKQGPSIGAPLTTETIIQDKSIDPLSGLVTRTFYAPDGLVYKWKEGIGVMVQFGSSNDINGPDKVGIPTIYKEPFAGQDVMNVLSLLITGVPYNFKTYWKAVGNDSYKSDPQTNRSAAETYFESIRTSLSKNNLLWGNFIPFKNLVIDEKSYAEHLKGQFRISENNSDLDLNLKKLSELANKTETWNVFSSSKVIDEYGLGSAAEVKTKVAFKALAGQVREQINDLREQDRSYYVQAGDDVSLDTNQDVSTFIAGEGQSAQSQILSKTMARKQLRRQVNFLSRRMSYNVRANDDKNLFIVDDFYDKDYDILAFNKELDDIKLYNNEFTSVKEKIKLTASILNLEVFCDTQGHIRVRAPQYNRMPSSVFYKMIRVKRANEVQIYPQFIDDLFKSKIDLLKQQIVLVEDYIRLQCAVLGYNNDVTCIKFINSLQTMDSTSELNSFSFLSLQSGSLIAIENIIKAVDDAEPSKNADFQSLRQQVKSTKDVFKTPDRAAFIVLNLESQILENDGTNIFENIEKMRDRTWIDNLSDRIFDNSGERVNLKTYITTLGTSTTTTAVITDLYKTTKELSDKIAERQKAIRLFYSTLKNSAEYKSLDENGELSNRLLTPGNDGNSNIPEIFEHMIEDENYDDYGPGSGSRYIIRNVQIKQSSFEETAPSYTAVDVRGILNQHAPDAVPDGLNTFPERGNALTTAMAVDYDMWRNYGMIKQATVKVPFLQNPNVQCAPYASMLLSRARKEVLKGSVTISGNEFMQPGEVVYLEDRGLLFYVNSVKHSLVFGNSFTTTLDLTYGHAPGEYIPTTLDIMGKMIYNNRDLASLVVHRQTSALNETPLGVVQLDKITKDNISGVSDWIETRDNSSNSPANSASIQNNRVINNILYTIAQFMNHNSGNELRNKLELRIYYNDENPIDDFIEKYANRIKETFMGIYNAAPVNSQGENNNTSQPPWLSEDDIRIVSINMDDDNIPYSPSQFAWNIVRDLISTRSMIDGGESQNDDKDKKSDDGTKTKEETNNQIKARKEQNKLRSALFKYIVDCWLVYDTSAEQETLGT